MEPQTSADDLLGQVYFIFGAPGEHDKERSNLEKIRLAMACAAISVMLVVSGFTALSIQTVSNDTATALIERNKTERTILAVKADIAESMFPAHHYLIEKTLGNKETVFSRMIHAIRQDMERLANEESSEHPEQRELKKLTAAAYASNEP